MEAEVDHLTRDISAYLRPSPRWSVCPSLSFFRGQVAGNMCIPGYNATCVVARSAREAVFYDQRVFARYGVPYLTLLRGEASLVLFLSLPLSPSRSLPPSLSSFLVSPSLSKTKKNNFLLEIYA